MQVLLIQPPVEDFYQTAMRTQPLGLAYCAQALRDYGISVGILDCQVPNKRRTVALPERFAHITRYYRYPNQSPFKLFERYYHFGLSWDEIREEIKSSEATIFGISSLFAPYYDQVHTLAKRIKEIDSRNITIVGGSNVTVMADRMLSDNAIDFVVFGEGERRFPLLIRSILSSSFRNIDGVGYRQAGRICINPPRTAIENLDSLAYPARDLLNLDNYTIGKRRYTMLLTSRGCPQQCTFCSVHLSMGRQYRARSPENIIGEMKECYEKFGIEVFDIEDDNFTWDRKRLVRFLELTEEYFADVPIELMGMNGFSLNNLDSVVLRKMRKSGFRTLNIAPVTTEPKQVTKAKRPYDFSSFKKVIATARDNDVTVTSYLILGMPEDTVDHMIRSIVQLAEEPVLIGPSVFYPTPKTELYELLKKKNLVDDDHYAFYRSTLVPIETEEIKRAGLITLFKLVRLINFIKKLRDESDAPDSISLYELISWYEDKLRIPEQCHVSLSEPLICTHPLDEVSRGIILLREVIERKEFYGLRVVTKKKEPNRVIQYEFFREETSPEMMELFLRECDGRLVSGYRFSSTVRIDWATRRAAPGEPSFSRTSAKC